MSLLQYYVCNCFEPLELPKEAGRVALGETVTVGR